MKKVSVQTKILFALLAPVIAVLILHHLATGFTIYNDGIGYYSYLRSAAIDKDLNFSNELRFYNASYSKFSSAPRGANYQEEKTPKGYIHNAYLIGSSVMWSPFFLTAHAATAILHSLGADIEPNGYTILYEMSIGLASLIYGFLAILLMYKFCRKWFGRKTSFVAVAGIWYGTSFFWYQAVEPSMAHMNSVFLGALFVYFWHSTLGKRTKPQWLMLGALLGLIYLVRQQDALLALLPGFEILKSLLSKAEAGKAIGRATILSAGAFAALLPQMLIWKRMYGSFLVYSYSNVTWQGQQGGWHAPRLLELLFSAEAGIWRVPLLLLSLVGLILFAKRVRGFTWHFLLVAALGLTVISMWTGGLAGGYGLRPILGMSVLFVLGTAEIIERMKTIIGLKWVYAIIAALIAANFINMALFLLGEVMSRIGPKELISIGLGRLF